MQAQAGTPPAQGGAPAGLQQNVQPDSVIVAPPMPLQEAVKRFGLKYTASPETVTVGQHFTVTVQVHVPTALASTVQFPTDIDTSTYSAVTSVGVGVRQDSSAGGFVDVTQKYEMAGWDVGAVPIGLGDLIVGKDRVPLGSKTVFVRSLLPKDSVTKLHTLPKEPRAVFKLLMIIRRVVTRAAERNRVIAAIVVLILLAGIGMLIVWLRSRRKKEAELIDWAKWAKHEFERIEAMHLLEKGQPELHAILMTNVLRESLVHQFPAVRASATTRELVSVLQRESLIPSERVLQLFERVDMFKFAGRGSEVEEARTIGLEDEAIVDEIETRRQVEIAAREAAARDAAQAEAAAKSRKGAA